MLLLLLLLVLLEQVLQASETHPSPHLNTVLQLLLLLLVVIVFNQFLYHCLYNET